MEVITIVRKDNKGRNLKPGESQRADGRYYYQTTAYGKRYTIYSWTLVVTDRTPAGKRKDLSLREKEEKLHREIDLRTISLGRETLTDVLDAYIKEITTKGKIRATTLMNYKKWAKIWKEYPIAKKKVKDIRPSDVDDACFEITRTRKLKRSTMSRIMVIARLAVAWYLKRQDILAANPFVMPLDQVCGKSSEPRVALSASELNEVFEAFRDGFGETNATYLMVRFISQSGLRLGEARGVLISDIDFENRQMRIMRQLLPGRKIGPTKSVAGERYIPITDELEKTIRMILARKRPKVEKVVDGHTGFLFVTKFGEPYSQTIFSNEIWAFCREHPDLANGKHISPHILRHTYATHLIQRGVSPSAVQYVLGHASLRPTLGVYVHSDREFAQAEILAKKNPSPGAPEEGSDTQNFM